MAAQFLAQSVLVKIVPFNESFYIHSHVFQLVRWLCILFYGPSGRTDPKVDSEFHC